MFIEEGEQIVSKTYMNRVEGRTHDYDITWHGFSKTLCYSLVSGHIEVFTPLAASLLEVSDSSSSRLDHYYFSNAEKSLCATYCSVRENWYRSRVSSAPSQKKFLEGWLHRVAAIKKLTVA